MPERPAPTAGALAKRFGLLGLIVTVLVALLGFLASTALASTLPHAQTRVAAIERPADQIVGPHETVLPGQGRQRAPNYDQHATGSSVAAEDGTAGGGSSAVETFQPGNNGFLGDSQEQYLNVGERIDRYGGSDYSRFFSPEGTPSEMRALPPGVADYPLRTFEVLKPFPVQAGMVAPAYGQLGLGTQYVTPVPLGTLLERGILGEAS